MFGQKVKDEGHSMTKDPVDAVCQVVISSYYCFKLHSEWALICDNIK